MGCGAAGACWARTPAPIVMPTAAQTIRMAVACVRTLLHFDELDRDAIRPLDHRRARVAPRVDLFEELHVLALQARDGGVQIRRAQRPVVVDLPARADEAAARPRPNRDRDVVE